MKTTTGRLGRSAPLFFAGRFAPVLPFLFVATDHAQDADTALTGDAFPAEGSPTALIERDGTSGGGGDGLH